MSREQKFRINRVIADAGQPHCRRRSQAEIQPASCIMLSDRSAKANILFLPGRLQFPGDQQISFFRVKDSLHKPLERTEISGIPVQDE